MSGGLASLVMSTGASGRGSQECQQAVQQFRQFERMNGGHAGAQVITTACTCIYRWCRAVSQMDCAVLQVATQLLGGDPYGAFE